MRFSFGLCLALACGSAFAADLPVRSAVKADIPTIVATNPFYIGFWGGIGLSPTENQLTFLGTAEGPVKAYPTGLMAGLTVGYANNSGPIYWGAAVEAAYDFSKGDVGGPVPGSIAGSRKNGFLVQEGVELGISMTTLGGYIPTSARPGNWPVPITVPASVWSNLIFAARGGLAQRDVKLCALDGTVDVNGNPNMPCASKFINGPYAGLTLKAMISANSEVRFVYDHVFWGKGSSFTPGAMPPAIFSNTIAIKDEDLFKVGYNYHF
jgi:hypothetical protein